MCQHKQYLQQVSINIYASPLTCINASKSIFYPWTQSEISSRWTH